MEGDGGGGQCRVGAGLRRGGASRRLGGELLLGAAVDGVRGVVGIDGEGTDEVGGVGLQVGGAVGEGAGLLAAPEVAEGGSAVGLGMLTGAPREAVVCDGRVAAVDEFAAEGGGDVGLAADAVERHLRQTLVGGRDVHGDVDGDAAAVGRGDDEGAGVVAVGLAGAVDGDHDGALVTSTDIAGAGRAVEPVQVLHYLPVHGGLPLVADVEVQAGGGGTEVQLARIDLQYGGRAAQVEVDGAGLTDGHVDVDLLRSVVGQAGLNGVFAHLYAGEDVVTLGIGGLGDAGLVADGGDLHALEGAVAVIVVIDDAGDAARGVHRVGRAGRQQAECHQGQEQKRNLGSHIRIICIIRCRKKSSEVIIRS